MNPKRRLVIVSLITGVIMFFAGLGSSYILNQQAKKSSSNNQPSTEISQYTRNDLSDIESPDLNKYINPLLDCEGNFGEIGPEFSEGLKKLTAELKKTPGITKLSVYFRQLKDGKRIGIDVHEQFIPASLLKVPLMIAAYKFLETHPEKRNQKYQFDNNLPPAYPNRIIGSKSLEKGKSYTLEELILFMIVYSDNNAASIIQRSIDPEVLKHVFKDLELKSVDEVKGIYGISAQGYATFLRILYNATYLNRTHSAKALETMSKAEYKAGLVAGLPQNTTIAHKFGERESENDRQLHDCGIIYRNDAVGEYLLCIMVKGDTYPKMEKIISEISRYVYNNADKSLISKTKIK